MPYGSKKDLPKAVKGLPSHHQSIFRAAFNNAYKQYGGDESRAFAVAWGAVKKARMKKSLEPVLTVDLSEEMRDLINAPLEKAWSDEARAAAAEARKGSGESTEKKPEKKDYSKMTPEELKAETKAHATRAAKLVKEMDQHQQNINPYNTRVSDAEKKASQEYLDRRAKEEGYRSWAGMRNDIYSSGGKAGTELRRREKVEADKRREAPLPWKPEEHAAKMAQIEKEARAYEDDPKNQNKGKGVAYYAGWMRAATKAGMNKEQARAHMNTDMLFSG